MKWDAGDTPVQPPLPSSRGERSPLRRSPVHAVRGPPMRSCQDRAGEPLRWVAAIKPCLLRMRRIHKYPHVCVGGFAETR